MDETSDALRTEGRDRGIVFLDYDGVINQGSSWRAVHHALGTADDADDHYEQFLEEDITFAEWGHLDAGLWAGTPESEFRDAIENIDLAENVMSTVDTLQSRGFRVGIVSGGVKQLIEMSVGANHFDFIIANEVAIENGEMTGEVAMDVTAKTKRDLFQKLASDHDRSLNHSVFIGDSRDDFAPIDRGLNIAFNAKDEITEDAGDVRIEGTDLSRVLPAVDGWLTGVATDVDVNPE